MRLPVETRNDEATKRLLLRIVADAGPGGIDEEDILNIVEWVQQARIDGVLLSLFDKGQVSLHWLNGELVVKAK